ncbi:hypothetical protein PROFUN_14339 [Planoprotostelium fungivorum]|uniref:Methylmalonyl-CoA epimerase, mitochondrial n=1 Tax=Planoprotostelium fungivorum TaxID=1890364 RepID=A0A2P6N0H1_9EUKA|nr:hypothetical protein PROFUN_14339 [Planoprotostelium fungivorum]
MLGRTLSSARYLKTSVVRSTTVRPNLTLTRPSSSFSAASDTAKALKIGQLNHVAIAVGNLEESVALYRDVLGAQVSEATDLPEHGVTTVFVNLGNTKIELLKPLGSNSPIQNFLDKKPAGGIHHICIEVDDIYKALEEVTSKGIKSIDAKPKIGAHGKPVVFLHPKSMNGVLVELEQKKKEENSFASSNESNWKRTRSKHRTHTQTCRKIRVRKGGKNRRRGKNEGEIKRELVFKEDGQEYAQVVRMLGNGRLQAQCFDGKERLAHIRGKLRKKVWVNQGDIILISLRDFQEEKADVILKYNSDEARLLKSYGELPESAKINESTALAGEEGESDIPYEFDGEDDSDDDASDEDVSLQSL